MTYATGTFDDFAPSGRFNVSRKRSFQIFPALVALAGSALVAALILDVDPAMAPGASRAVLPEHRPASKTVAALPDPALSLAFSSSQLGQSTPLGSDLVWTETAPPAAPSVPAARSMPAAPSVSDVVADSVVPPVPALSPLVANIPMPVPRPTELGLRMAPEPARPPSRMTAAPTARPAAPQAPPPDSRSVFEKLFGLSQPSGQSGPTLAYAAPEDGVVSRLFGTTAPANPDRLTAVYDIAAHTVFMPNGTQLEAHSGLGNLLDDPRYVNARNRGPTPPHLYDLEPRAQLFHGVRALRLTPVGNGSVFGRVGLLAHTFMLGPNGDSNGCVSFRNYNAFLQAYMNGEVKRLVVVARRT